MFLFTWRQYPLEHIVHMAIATSLATILFTSLSSVRAHHQRGAVLWPVVAVRHPGILVGLLIGARHRRSAAHVLAVDGLCRVRRFLGIADAAASGKPRPSRELPKGAGMFLVSAPA